MAGGTFTRQNKVRPGVYVNFNSAYRALGTIGERGTVLLPLRLPFGAENSPVLIDGETDVFSLLGMKSEEDSLLLLRQAAKKAKKVLLYRLNCGEKATETAGGLTAAARYSGSLGNSLSVSVTAGEEELLVESFYRNEKFDSQRVSSADKLQDNQFIVFSAAQGASLSSASFGLTGGTDGADDWEQLFADAAAMDFDTAAIPSDNGQVKAMAVAFVKNMRENEGKKIQLVLANSNADDEGVISLANGVVLSDNTTLTAAMATAYIAALTAASEVNVSNTYAAFDDAVDVTRRYSNSEIEALLRAGQMVFVVRGSKVLLEQDINSFVSALPEKGRMFSKNRLIRVLDSIERDVRTVFENSYIGKMSNSPDGRRLLQAELYHYLQNLEQLGAVTGVSTEDIEVLPGDSVESVVINVAVRPVDSMEKLYMTVTAE